MIQPLSSFVGFQGSWATAKVCSSVGLTISPTQKIEANEPKPRSFTSRGTSELGEKRWAGNLSKNPAEERNFPETKAGGEGVSFEFFLFQIISIHRTLSICCFVFLTIEVAGFVRSSEVPGLCFRWRGLQVGIQWARATKFHPRNARTQCFIGSARTGCLSSETPHRRISGRWWITFSPWGLISLQVLEICTGRKK